MADHQQLKIITMRALGSYSTARKKETSIRDFFVAKHASREHKGTKDYLRKLANR